MIPALINKNESNYRRQRRQVQTIIRIGQGIRIVPQHKKKIKQLLTTW
jgi:hypothetical protein